jgi:threonine dehydratase
VNAATLPCPADVIAAERRIREESPETPLWRSPGLSALIGAEIWIKAEIASTLTSFKLRGALNHLLAEPGEGGACTASTGNHGQAVAYAAKLLGFSADIFVPHGSPETKLAAIRRLGATLHIGGNDLDDAKSAAQRFARRQGLRFVDDGESPHVIAGAGTIGLEIGRRLPEARRVYVPTGSGCLASGTAIGLMAAGAQASVVAVSTVQTPCMIRSFHAKRPVEHPVNTICDCLNQRIPPALSLACMIEYVADALEVDDLDCLSSMHTLLAEAHVLVEPGAAASLAGAWAQRAALRDQLVVLVLSGANVDLPMIRRALATAPLARPRTDPASE